MPTASSPSYSPWFISSFMNLEFQAIKGKNAALWSVWNQSSNMRTAPWTVWKSMVRITGLIGLTCCWIKPDTLFFFFIWLLYTPLVIMVFYRGFAKTYSWKLPKKSSQSRDILRKCMRKCELSNARWVGFFVSLFTVLKRALERWCIQDWFAMSWHSYYTGTWLGGCKKLFCLFLF